MATILDDTILRDDIANETIKIKVNKIYDFITAQFQQDTRRGRQAVQPKNINEFFELVEQGIQHYQTTRAETPTNNQVTFTLEEPDNRASTEYITASIVKRGPGLFDNVNPQTTKKDSGVRFYKPIFMESVDDKENPTYRLLYQMYYYDNIVKFTCWARTNKEVNKRMIWFNDFMKNYHWWFTQNGIDKLFHLEQGADILIDVDDVRWYGRPLTYFIRTQEIEILREKTLEHIIVDLVVKQTEED